LAREGVAEAFFGVAEAAAGVAAVVGVALAVVAGGEGFAEAGSGAELTAVEDAELGVVAAHGIIVMAAWRIAASVVGMLARIVAA
jgi:hypothetical protein